MRRLLALLTLSVSILASSTGSALAGTRTINFDEATEPTLFMNTAPLTDRYAPLGVTFAGPVTGSGGAILNGSSFAVTGESEPNFLAFNNTASYPGGGTPTGPETITFATPIHSASIKAGQSGGGTITLKAFDGTTQVFSDTGPSTSALKTLDVSAPRITSLRLEFTGGATVWDDLTWGTAPVSAGETFGANQDQTLAVPAAGVLRNDTDADGDTLTAERTRNANNGNVDLRADGSFTYTPRAGFSGADSFDYRANDGTGSGNVATVTINVAASPPPLALLPSTTSIGSLAYKKYTKLAKLSVRNLLPGTTVKVTCKTKKKRQQKKGCAYKSRTFKTSAARASLNLRKPFKKKKVPVGAKIVIKISTPGYIGKQITYTIRKGKIPKSRVQCVPPGGKAGRCT